MIDCIYKYEDPELKSRCQGVCIRTNRALVVADEFCMSCPDKKNFRKEQENA